jgi:hypothetical protein
MRSLGCGNLTFYDKIENGNAEMEAKTKSTTHLQEAFYFVEPFVAHLVASEFPKSDQ